MFIIKDERYKDFGYLKYIHTDSKRLLHMFDEYSSEHDIYFQNKKKYIPDKIYKFYKPTKYSYDSISNGYVWISNPSYFNDPFEGDLDYDKDGFIRRLLADFIQSSSLVKNNSSNYFSETEYNLIRFGLRYDNYNKMDVFNIKQRLLKSKSEELSRIVSEEISRIEGKFYDLKKQIEKENYYVCSFTVESGNLPMWAHYTNNYEGFCVEYDLTNIKSNNDKSSTILLNRFFPVKYTSKVPKISKTHLIKKNMFTSQVAYDNKKLHAITNKDQNWSYEGEWRLILDKKNKYGFKFEFPFASKIICGYNMKREDINRLHQIAVDKNIDLQIKHKSKYVKGSFLYTYEEYLEELDRENNGKLYDKLFTKKKRMNH